MYELIVLSLLMSGSAHGYSIIKTMNDIAGPYTKFSHGRLYPLLVRLEEEGSVVTVDNATVEQTKGRPLHSYEITEKGRERFHELMMNITSNVGDYQKLFLQVHGMSPSHNNALVKIMRHVADQWQLELEWANGLLEEERAQQK